MPRREEMTGGALPIGYLGPERTPRPNQTFMGADGLNINNIVQDAINPRTNRTRRRRRATPRETGNNVREFLGAIDDENRYGSDGSDDLVAGTRESRERKRRATKAQKEAAALEPLLRPTTEFPPELKAKQADLLRMQPRDTSGNLMQGAGNTEMVAALEKDKYSWKENKGTSIFDMGHVIDKHNRRMNTTNLEGFKKKKVHIGLDDEEIEYDNEAVIWEHRDEALKTPVDFGTPSAYQRATSRAIEHHDRESTIDSLFEDRDAMDLGGGSSPDFQRLDDLDNTVDPDDVTEVVSRPEVRNQTLTPATISPAHSVDAEARAKELQERHKLNFFNHDGTLDEEKILQTEKIPKPQELQELEDTNYQIKHEEDDELFFAEASEEQAREYERQERLRMIAPLQAKHEAGQRVFDALKAAIVALREQREEAMLSMPPPRLTLRTQDISARSTRPVPPQVIPLDDGRGQFDRSRQPPSGPAAGSPRDSYQSRDGSRSVWSRDFDRGPRTDHRRGHPARSNSTPSRGGRSDQSSSGGDWESSRPCSHNSRSGNSNHEHSRRQGQHEHGQQFSNRGFDRRGSRSSARGRRDISQVSGWGQRDRGNHNHRAPSCASSGWASVTDDGAATPNNEPYVPWNPTDDDLDPIKAQFGGR